MHGIVSLLDNHHYQLIEDLWAELEREYSVRGVYITPYPHFSYQIAPDYNIEQVEPILHRIASNSRPFSIRTSGLGIFTGTSPVLYIPVVRSPELTRFHETLWPEISQAASGIVEYYSPEQWMPHITIGFGDMSKDKLGHIVRFLSERSFTWEIPTNNIALIYDTGTKQELKSRFDFKTALNSR